MWLWNSKRNVDWKAVLGKDTRGKKVLEAWTHTSNDKNLSDAQIVETTNIIKLLYHIYRDEFDEMFKYFLKDFFKTHRSDKSKLAALPLLLWLYWFYVYEYILQFNHQFDFEIFYLFFFSRVWGETKSLLEQIVLRIEHMISIFKVQWLQQLITYNFLFRTCAEKMLYYKNPTSINHYCKYTKVYSTQLVFVQFELILLNMHFKTREDVTIGDEHFLNSANFIRSIIRSTELEGILSSPSWNEIIKHNLIEGKSLLSMGIKVLENVNKLNAKILTNINYHFFLPFTDLMIAQQGFHIVVKLAVKIKELEKELLGDGNTLEVIYKYYSYIESDKYRLTYLASPKTGISNLIKALLIKEQCWERLGDMKQRDGSQKRMDFLFLIKKLLLSTDEVIGKIPFISLKGIPLHEITNINPTLSTVSGNETEIILDDKLPDCYIIIRKYLEIRKVQTLNEIAALESKDKRYNPERINNQIKDAINQLFNEVLYFYENSIPTLLKYQPDKDVNTNSTSIDCENKYFNNLRCYDKFLQDSFTFLFTFIVNDLSFFPEFLTMLGKLGNYSRSLQQWVGDNKQLDFSKETMKTIAANHLGALINSKNKERLTRNYFLKIACLQDGREENYLLKILTNTICEKLISIYNNNDVDSTDTQIISNLSELMNNYLGSYAGSPEDKRSSSPWNRGSTASRLGVQPARPAGKALPPPIPGLLEEGKMSYSIIDWKIFVKLLDKITHLQNKQDFTCTKGKVNLLKVCKDAFASESKPPLPVYKRKFHEFINKYKQQLLQIHSPDVLQTMAYKGIRTMNQSIHFYMEIADCLQFNGIKYKETLAELDNEFNALFNQMKEIHSLYGYLINPPYCFDNLTQLDKVDNEESTYEQVEEQYNDLLSTLTNKTGISLEDIHDLSFFIHSTLFEAFSFEFLGIKNPRLNDEGNEAAMRISLVTKQKQLVNAIHETKNVMNAFLSDKISIDVLEKHLVLLNNENIEGESDVFCKYLSSTSDISVENVKKKLDSNLTAAYDIIRMKNFAPLLLDFNHFIDEDSINQLSSLLQKASHYSIVELIEKIKKQIGGMDLQQFRYFEKLRQFKKILQLKYFKYNKKKFMQEIDIAKNNSTSSNNEYGHSILSTLEIAYDLLQPVQQQLTAQEKQPDSRIKFSELCAQIKQVLEKGKLGLDKKLASFEEVLKGECALLSYFSTNASLEDLDFFCNVAIKLIENGIYKSRLSLHPKGKSLQFRTRKTPDAPGEKIINLQDIIKALHVFADSGKGNLSNKNRHIKEFLGIYPKAIEIHELQLKLEAAGHPKYRGINTIINGAKKLSIQLFDAILVQLKNEEKHWEQSILKSYKKYERLLFLDRAQLANVVSGLVNYFESFPFEENGVLNEELFTSIIIQIDPYLWSCFPDPEGLASKEKEKYTRDILSPSNDWIIQQKALVLNNAAGKAELSSVSLLHFIGELTQKLYDILKGENLIEEDEYMQNTDKPVGYIVQQFTDFEIAKHIYEMSELKKPSFSQILFCDKAAVNLTLLQQFLDRVSVFSHLYYYIVNVDLLDVELREYLLDWLDCKICAMTSNDNNAPKVKVGRLAVYFTASSSAERFLSLLTINTVQKQSLAGIERFSDIRRLPLQNNINVIEYFTSPHDTGKSYDIQKKLANTPVANQLFISLYEDFTANHFINLLKNQYQLLNEGGEERSREIHIHLDISAYSPLRLVNRFLELLLCNGYIWDERTGNMLKLHNGYEYYFYIELHTSPAEDESFNHQSSTMPSVLNYLSILNIIGKEVKGADSPLEITDNYVKVVEWWNIYNSAIFAENLMMIADIKETIQVKVDNIQTIIANKNQLLAKENEYRKIFTEIQLYLKNRNISFPKGKRYQNLFLSYMSVRSEYIWLYICYIYTSAIEDQMDISSISQIRLRIFYEVFLIESARLAEERIGNQLTVNPPLTVFRGYRAIVPSFIYFNSCDAITKRRLVEQYNGGFSIHTREDLMENNEPNVLRGNLQQVFNVEKLFQIIEDHKYVLTPDFAFKLYFIYERMKARENVMLSGGTGVGKTELLTLYSSIINTDVNLTFDIIYSLKKIINATIFPEIEKRNPQLKLPVLHSHQVTEIEQVIEYLSSLEANSLERFKVMSHYICKDIIDNIKNYPLLDYKSNGYVARLVRLKHQPIDWEEDQLAQQPIIVDSMNKLISLLKEYAKCTFKKIFYTIRMHQGMSAERLRIKILAIIQTAKEIESIYQQLNNQAAEEEKKRIEEPSIVVFIDEVNTTSVMGMIKSIFCDKKIDNITIPHNILWVCAINPFIKAQTNDKMSMEIEKFTGLGMDERIYSVREVPQSLKNLTIDFDTLTEDQENMFIASLLRLQNVCDNHHQYHSLTKLTLFSQRLLQRFKIHRMQVSIRDIMRTVTLYDFFRKNTCLLGATVRGTDPSNSIHWQALIMAIGTSYYLRLFSEYRNQFEEQFKEEMNNMRISNRNHECPPQLARNFGETMKSSMQHLYDNTKIPPGIACTQALLENLWSIVVCCSAMIPIIIIGPPGCSKTLSFSIAIENMSREIPDSEKTFYNHLPKLDPIRYQCSAQSTDIEIKKRYKEALARQRLYDADSAGAKSLGEVNRSVVFLDEAGLTGDKPLKVIHYYMDHPKVCTVILSNELLDAAKMNRGLQVYQNPTSHEDLISLAKGSLGIHDEKIIDKLCSAYKQTVQEGNQFTSSLRSKGLFQLRDFIYFLRYIRATAVVNGRFQITGTILLRALQRNFNGITKANLKHLVALWFKELNHVLPMPLEIPSIFKPTIDLIRENLDYRMSPNENPNTSAFRFLLLIDPTENETAVSLLYSTNLCKVDTNNAKISLLPNSIDTEAYLATMDRCEFNASVDVATFPPITKVRAIRKYQANQHHELSFLFGDEIIVRNENLKLDGWWQGELVRTGRIGLFPYAFTSIIELEGEEVPEYLASVLSPFPKNEKYDSPIHIQSFQPKEAKKNIRKYYNPNKAVQICLGDFALDKTDDEITDAVRKVIDAMKDGKIVILVNSNLINGSFYDLFNRYFKIVKKHNEDGDDYYANVALGSFSRQCKVHKDFKVIIHLPQSKLNQTALPFLTRFEKYILSTQDVLDDLLESKPWARIPLVTSTNGKNTFVELLQKGCDEFVREIHEKDNDSRLLYGVVNTETVSSLVLESALRSDADIPNIKLMNYRKLVEETENSSQANQKLQENKESAVEKPISEFNKSSVEGKLRSLIRKANFKLLQVARPDLLFTTVRVKGIPHYIYEYFMNQEHFSVFRFLKNLINIHLRQLRAQSNSESPNESTEEGMEVDTGRGKQEVHTNKWCIFTRTSGEFEQLSSKDNLKKLLSEKLEKENAMEKYEIHTIQLEMIQSSKLLEQELSELCKNDHSLILYSIDMKKCTPTQINQLRRLIDHYLDAKALFVLILHFPAELFLSRAPWCYNTIYLHSWEFIYIDSLGFTMNKLNNQSIQYWEDVDARSWIAKAFGLKINHLSMDDEKMYEHYKREIIIICKNYIKKYKPDTTPPKNIQCMKIYMPGYNNKVNERYEVIDELLNHEEYILQAFIRRFINSWSKELLNKVVNSVCENLIKGNLFNSFVNTVQNTLDHFLSANVYQLMEVLLKNYQLEHCSLLLHESKNNHSSCGNKKQSVGVGGKGLLASGGNLKSASSGSAIFRNKSQFEWREIYKKTINLLKPVEFQLISQIEEKVEHNLTLVVDFPYICKTPMFPFIYTTLEKYVDILFLEFNLHHSTISILIHHFILLIEKNKNLMDLMQTVTRMKKKFLDDFLIKKFSIPVPSNHFHRPPGPNPHQKGKMLLKIMQSIVDKIVVDAIESGDISSGNKDTSALLNESATLKKNMTKDTYILLGYFVCSRYYFDKFRYIRDFIDPLHHNLFNILPIQHPILPHIHTNLSDYHNDFPLYQLGNISLSKCKYLDLYLIKLFFSILINSLSQIFNDFPINKQPQVANMEEIVNKYKLWSHLYSQFNARTSNIHSILSYFHLNKPESPADQQLVESYLKMNTLYLFSRDFNLYSKENQPQLTKLFSSGVLRNYFIKNEELFKKPAKQDEEINELYYSLQTLSLLFSEFDGFVKASPQQTSKLLKHVCRSVFKGRRTLESTNYTLTLFLENTRTLFQLINADLLPIFPNIQHAWNEVVEFDWYLNLVYSFISKRLRISSSDEDGKQAIQFEKQKQTLLNSMNYMGNEILNSNYLSSNAHFDAKKDYKYIYSLLIDDQPTIQANNNAKNTNLEDLFYHIHCKLCESQSVEELCEEYKLLKEKDDATIIEIIQLSATVSNILKNSGKYVKSEGDKVENLPDSLVEIFEKDNKGSPMHADVYFLQKHFPESINILSNPQRLNQFGFSKEWYEPQISKNNIFHKYSFMIDRTEKGLLYQEMKAVIMNNNNPAQWIQQKVAGQGERMMYISRMYLLLILFYEYFDVLLPFPPHIAQLFANQQIIGILKITASEMAAYQFILAGARVLNEDIERKDDLLRLFSRNIRQKKEDLAACYLLVNVLACCLGTPPNSNHFYKSIFELPTLNGYKMPGSACGGREFYDCGYKMSETGVLDHAGILQNHSRYRLGLNGLIWLPICWHVMLNEGTAVAVCKSLYHFINCIGDAAYGGRNELQQYRSYIASRAIGFCNVLSQDATMVERNININLFLVESLHQFSDFIQSNLGRLPNAYRHQFASVAECEQYEAQIMNLFQNVLNNYDAVKQIYQNTVIPNSPTERLTKIQDKQAKIYTKLSFKGVVDDQIVNEARNHLISVSNKFKSILDILPLMPTLATAYYHLTHELSYKLPRHMINSPVKEVFEYLRKQITLRQIPSMTFTKLDSIKQQFTKLCDAFVILQKTILDFNNDCQVMEIPKINEECLLSVIVSQEGGYDIIINTINTLMLKLSEIFAVLRKKKYSHGTLNEHELYFPRENLEKNYDLTSLIHQIHHPISIPVVEDQFEPWMNELMSLNMHFDNNKANKNTILLVESISLDCENVNRELLMFYNSMKEFVSSVAFHSLQKAFYSSEDLPNLLEQCKNAIKLNNIDYLSMMEGRSNIQRGSVQNLEMIENTLKTLEPINQLKYLINKKLNKQFPEYCADLKSLDIPKSTLHKMKEETVNKMAENIIKLIKSLDDANAPDKNSKIIDELQKLNISDTPECIQLFYKSMCYLQAVANKVIELSNQKPWIYSIYGALTKINETLTAQLDAIKSKYNIKQMELEKLGGLRARTKRLLELLTHEKTLAELRHSTNKKILSFLNRLQMEKPPISYEDLLPESTEFLRYSQYMFWFHSFCGEIEYYHSIKLQQRSAAPVSSSSSAHKPAARYNELEWVPIECKQMENKNNIRSETKRLDLMNEENDDSEYDIEILNLIEEREATLQIPDEFNEYNSSNTKAIGAPGLRGIRNPGLNICWLTSLLQCIACTKGVIGDLQELRIAMNSATRKNDAQKTISYFIIDVMQQLYDEGHSKSAIDASTLFFKLGQMDYKYYFREQQDPSEFYNLYFSNNIPNELNRMKLLNFANRFNLPIKTTMNCLADASHSEILAHESQNTLFVLSVSEEVNTFDKALDLLFNSSVDTKCTKSAECKSANKMKRIRLEFMNNAKVEEEGGAGSGKFLVFHLQRSQMHHKVTSKMVIPTDPFDFSGYSLLPAGCTLKGTLYAAIIHQGDYTYFGHYIALKKIEEDWYECNDSCVSLCPNAPQLISSNGYMLFFSLECSSPPPLPSLPSPLPISLDPPAPSIPPASDSTNPYRSTTSQAGSSYQSIPPSPPVYSIQNQATHSSSTPPAPSQPAGYPPGNDPRLPYGAGSVALTQQHNYYQYYLDIIRFFLQNLWPHIGLDDPFILLQNHSQLSLFDLFERIFHFIWKSPPNPSVITTALQYSPTPRNLIDYILHLHTNPFPPPSSPANPSQFPPSTHPQYNYSSFGAGQQGNISGFYHSTGSFHNTPSFSSPYGSSHLPHPSNTPPGQYHPGQPLAVASNPLAVSSFHPSVSTSPLFHQSPSPNLFQSVPPQQAGLDPHRSFLPSSPSPPSTASFHSSIAHSPSSSSPMHHAYPQPELSSSLSASHLSHGFLQSPSSNSQSTAGYPATPHSQSGYPTSTHSQSGYPGTPQPQSQASGYPGTPQTQSGYPGYPQSGQSTGQPSSGYVQSGQYVGQASGYPHPGNMSGQPTNAQAAGYPQPGQSIGQSAGYPQPQAAGYPQQGQAYGYSQPEPSSGNLPSHGYPQAEFRNAQQLGQSRYDSQSAQYQQTHLNGNPNPTAQNVPWPGYPK